MLGKKQQLNNKVDHLFICICSHVVADGNASAKFTCSHQDLLKIGRVSLTWNQDLLHVCFHRNVATQQQWWYDCIGNQSGHNWSTFSCCSVYYTCSNLVLLWMLLNGTQHSIPSTQKLLHVPAQSILGQHCSLSSGIKIGIKHWTTGEKRWMMTYGFQYDSTLSWIGYWSSWCSNWNNRELLPAN